MSVKWKITWGIIGAALIVTPAAVAWAQPQAAACALINYRGLDEVAPGILASSDVTLVTDSISSAYTRQRNSGWRPRLAPRVPRR
jgi:hypothetical protein